MENKQIKTTYILTSINHEEVKAWITTHPNHYDLRKVGLEYLGWTVKDADLEILETGLEQLVNSKIIKSWYKDTQQTNNKDHNVILENPKDTNDKIATTLIRSNAEGHVAMK